MRSGARGLGVVMVSALAMAGTMVGCLGGDDNTGPPGNGSDASIPFPDGAVPRLDSGTDSSRPDSTVDSSLPDTGAPDTNAPDTAPTTAQIRVAWFVTDPSPQVTKGRRAARIPAGNTPSYDVCVAPHGTGQWQGPLMAAIGGLQQFDVTAYQTVAPGQYDVRIVETPQTQVVGADASTTTCNDLPPAPVTQDPDAGDAGPTGTDFTLPAVQAGQTITIVFNDPPAGSTLPYAQVLPFIDEPAANPGMARARTINVSEIAEPVDVGAGGGVAFTPWFKAVPSDTYLDPAADPLGYRDVTPVSIDFTLQTNGGDRVSTDPLSVAAGDVLTFFGTSAQGDGRQFVMVTCRDGKTASAAPAFSDCVVSTQLAQPGLGQARFGDFLADGPGPLDLCIKYHQQPSYGAPIVLSQGSDAGVAFGDVTPYLAVHGGFTYDLRLVAAGSPTCATAAVPEGSLVMPLGTGYYDARVTVAAAGYMNPPDGGAVTLPEAGAPVDAGPDADAGPTSPELTSLGLTYAVFHDADMSWQGPALRVVHLAATYPQPITADNGNWAFTNVPYGGFGTPSGVDSYGYAPTPVGSANPTLTTGETFNANVNDGDLDTMYIVPGPKSGSVLVVYCTDSALINASCTLEQPEVL